MYDVCIIGAGPAGISSAIYTASRGFKVLVLEQERVGGTIAGVSTVTHYAGVLPEETGYTFSKRLKNQAVYCGAEIAIEKVVKVDLLSDIKKIYTTNNVYKCKAVIIASGTTPRNLGIAGEKEFAGKGTMLNALYDGAKYTGKEMFVIGGADGAVKEALYLSQYAKKLTIVHFEDELGAIAEFKNRIKEKSNIEVLLHSRLTKIKGDDEVNELVITDEHTKEERIIKSQGCGIFVYAGSTPNSEMYPDLVKDNGYIVTDERQKTNIDGVFAVGDICKKEIRQIATAVSDGVIAGINAVSYIKSRTDRD